VGSVEELFRISILRLALKRGFFIEFDAAQFYGDSKHHYRAGFNASISEDGNCLVADLLLDDAPEIALQAENMGYTVEVVGVRDWWVQYNFILPPAE
jgi:hypothetical protein